MDSLFPLPDPATLHAALLRRDPAYEGRAWVGVTTTGIFCRLTCPARKPRPENCRWFDSPAAALSAPPASLSTPAVAAIGLPPGLSRIATLGELFDWRVTYTPDAEAYRHFDAATQSWQSLSWAQAGQQVQRWMRALQAEALPVGSRVARVRSRRLRLQRCRRCPCRSRGRCCRRQTAGQNPESPRRPTRQDHQNQRQGC